MYPKLKFWVYRYHVLIAVLLLSAAILLPVLFREAMKDWRIFVPMIGGLFAFVFGVEKHRLDEDRLFRELFAEFNKRYDALGLELNRIRAGDNEIALRLEEIGTLFQYFNLCAEEFLYYRKGYIDPGVWQAWQNGMKIFAENPRIRELWVRELATDSYYGFILPDATG
jgi:hypothetical protein